MEVNNLLYSSTPEEMELICSWRDIRQLSCELQLVTHPAVGCYFPAAACYLCSSMASQTFDPADEKAVLMH